MLIYWRLIKISDTLGTGARTSKLRAQSQLCEPQRLMRQLRYKATTNRGRCLHPKFQKTRPYILLPLLL